MISPFKRKSNNVICICMVLFDSIMNMVFTSIVYYANHA